ncbi:MAG: Esterase of the alpha-beta hydrolase superfamily [Verrucomicrobiaceae bacterium]|nr:Esterase of the alpha-beta hydrolase superfamily [Verrucomicrobiaceae bacterium]
MPRIAISLGASFLGYATHAGFMARLHELGVRPVKVAGASAGAIAAGLYAAGLPQDRIKEEVLRLWMRLAFVHGTPWFIHQLRSFLLSRHPSFFNPRAAVTHLQEIVGDVKIEDLHSPSLSIALTRLDTYEPVLAQRGPLARTMVNSCCVPVLFAPLEFEGAMCVDGGVANEVPVDQWFDDDEVDIIITHRITSPNPPRSRFFPGNVMGITGDAHETTSRQLMQYRQALAQQKGKRLLMADTVHPRPSMVFGHDMSGFYATGMEHAQKFYDSTLRPLLDA